MIWDRDREAGSLEEMVRVIERKVEATARLLGRGRLDERVLAALREVPREEFVPTASRGLAFTDGPLPIGRAQTISQPYIVAVMTDLLGLGPAATVLEVGTGSGYQAAVLSRVVSQVYSIEKIPDLAQAAAERLQRLGYRNVVVRAGDGYFGWPEHGPYDGILVTAAAPHVPQPLVEQLEAGGRLVIPVDAGWWGQELLVVEKSVEGGLTSRAVLDVAFVPLTGEGHDLESQDRALPDKP